MKLLIIYNSQAARGRAKKLLPDIQKAFADKGVIPEIRLTAHPGHATEIVAAEDLSAFQGVIAAGGDGTLFEVLNGLYRHPASARPPLGVLPTGTGNAFARELNLLKTDWQHAIDIIAAGNTRKVDVGRFTCGSKIYYFLNILGFGFVADVGKTAHRLKFFGNTAYTLGVLYRLLFLNSNRAIFEHDGRITEYSNIFVEISNSRYTGTSFLMAPDAKVDDGLLDITILSRISRRRLLKIFPTIFDGSHLGLDCVTAFKSAQLKITTDLPMTLNADGELLGSTPIEATCIKADLDIFWAR
jgi:YegS/Rv2252/BmrU family lipid kinase